ncbi:MAG: hypothetical protein K9M57_01955 [Phycisphaerae bacterium]|nr:hypothetical protein [Phycisphaerae bacterium]
MNFINTYDAGVKNQYATVGGVSVSYDDAGNMTGDHRGYIYEYDYENRLTRIYEMDGQNEVDIANYTYDALGRRIMVEDPIADTSTTYYYDGWRVLSEFEADTSSTPEPTIQRDFTWGNYLDEALVMTSTVSSVSTDHYYAHNHLYSPVALLDSAGAIEEYYEYDAYGQMTAYTDAGTDGNWLTADDTIASHSAQASPIAFTGQRLDFKRDRSYLKGQSWNCCYRCVKNQNNDHSCHFQAELEAHFPRWSIMSLRITVHFCCMSAPSPHSPISAFDFPLFQRRLPGERLTALLSQGGVRAWPLGNRVLPPQIVPLLLQHLQVIPNKFLATQHNPIDKIPQPLTVHPRRFKSHRLFARYNRL